MNLFLLFLILPFFAFGAGPITPNRYTTSLLESGSGGSLIASYGQLSLATSQPIEVTSASTWYAVPFDTFSPSSNVNGSTTSPATLTIQQAGVYQINVSLYFSSEDSVEDTFTQATYTLGIGTNGTVVARSAVFAGEAGDFSLNYSALNEFSVGDTLQFYIEASAVGAGGPFLNIVTMLHANAAVVQIAQ